MQGWGEYTNPEYEYEYEYFTRHEYEYEYKYWIKCVSTSTSTLVWVRVRVLHIQNTKFMSISLTFFRNNLLSNFAGISGPLY